ncbi:unnamed protein product [Aphanomyces euteiches]|uniref:Uncharacterized protein n=1 Tax=Aphanomyces euteiches TaxID=100861 RepID=A0A6G0W820_9STRA|nr:hypothetical protein Ae201684_018570 [Aphanomyces euteiches]KAH9151383.1 hypothetical protein AeRB84_005997 [Aphanomyces euteiches]
MHALAQILWHDEFAQALGIVDYLLLSSLSREVRDCLRSLYPTEVVSLSQLTPMEIVGHLQTSWPNIRFSFHSTVRQPQDLAALASFYALSFTRNHSFTQVCELRRVHTVCFDSCDGLQDVSGLTSVRDLKLKMCPKASNASLATLTQLERLEIYRCVQLTDLSALTSLKNLVVESSNQYTTAMRIQAPNLSFCRLVLVAYSHREVAHVAHLELVNARAIDQEASAMTAQHSRFVCHQSRLTDVTWLHGVQAVDLTGSWCLHDISPLRNVFDVNLTGCSAVVDVSPLRHVTKLNLTHCFRVTDVSALSHVRELNLTGCWNIRDVSALTHVEKLDLTGVGKLESIDGLEHVRDLSLAGNRFLKLRASLAHVERLDMKDCIQVDDLEALRGIPSVTIDGCRQVRSIEPLASAKNVELVHLPLISDITPLARASKVRLLHCASIQDVGGLSQVDVVYLERIPFRSARGLHKVPHLTIHNCWGFQDCAMLPSNVKLNGCGCPNHEKKMNQVSVNYKLVK